MEIHRYYYGCRDVEVYYNKRNKFVLRSVKEDKAKYISNKDKVEVFVIGKGLFVK